MLSMYKRWRIVKSIESGEPLARSIASALENSPELRAYADAMRRVHEGLGSTDVVYSDAGLAERVLREIECEAVHESGGSRATSSRLEPIGFIRPLGLAAAVVLVSGMTVLSIRPWSVHSSIEVTGDFTTLISLFQPIDEEGMMGWMDRSLGDEFSAIREDAQNMAGVFEGIPGALLIGENQDGTRQ